MFKPWDMDIKYFQFTERLPGSAACCRALVFALLLLSPLGVPRMALAQDTIHWAYSSFLGTGWYQVEDELNVFVARVPISWTLRETDQQKRGVDGIGITFELPVTLGLYRLELFDDLLDADNFGTVSLTPGVETEWAVTEQWWLRGFAHFGWGIDTQNDQQAWLWDAGMKSRFLVGSPERPVGLFAEVFTAGYRTRGVSANNLGGLGAGIDFRQPVSWQSNAGEPLDLIWDLRYRWYGDELTFNTTRQASTSIDDEWRIGAALALRDRPIRLWFFELDQLGLSYRVSSDGQFRGLTINISGPFRG